MDDIYEHIGWLGQEYNSNFSAKWGVILLSEMWDGRTERSIASAVRTAREMGFEYVITPKPSPAGNHLYKITPKSYDCVYGILKAMRRCAERNKNKYASNLKFRVGSLLKEARNRHTLFDLDENEIISKIEFGKCEATGIDFELKPHSPFVPSLDQILPGKGYIRGNVRVVCLIYNRMKSDYSKEDVDKFIKHLRGSQ